MAVILCQACIWIRISRTCRCHGRVATFEDRAFSIQFCLMESGKWWKLDMSLTTNSTSTVRKKFRGWFSFIRNGFCGIQPILWVSSKLPNQPGWRCSHILKVSGAARHMHVHMLHARKCLGAFDEPWKACPHFQQPSLTSSQKLWQRYCLHTEDDIVWTPPHEMRLNGYLT